MGVLGEQSPKTTRKKATVLAERFEKFGESYFLFIDNPEIEPTNNAAEREIRTLVIDRKITHRGIAATQRGIY